MTEKSSDVKIKAGESIDDFSSAFDKKIETTKDVASDITEETKDKVKKGAKAVSEKSSDVKVKVGGLFDDVSAAFDKKVETTQDITSDVRKDIADKVKVEAKVVPEKGNDMKAKVEGFFGDVGSAFNKEVETTKDIATGVKKDTDDKVKEAAKAITEKYSDVKTKAAELFDDVETDFDKKVETTKYIASDITKETKDKVKEEAKGVSDKSSDINEKIGGFFDDVSTIFDKKVETTQDIASDVKKDIVDKVNVEAKVVPEKISDVKTKVEGFFGDLGSAFNKEVETTKDIATCVKKDTDDKVKKSAKAITEKSSDVKTKAGVFFDGVGNVIDKKVDTTKDVASDITKETKDNVKGGAKAVSDKSNDVKVTVGGFIEDVNTAFDKKFETTKDVATVIKKDTEDKVNETVKTVTEKSSDVKTKVGGFIDDLGSAFDKKFESSKEVASDITEETKDKVKDGAKVVSEKNTDMKTKVGGFFDDVGSAFNKEVETSRDIATVVKKDTDDKVKEAAKAITEKNSDVKTKAGEFFDDVGTAFDKNVETTKDIASDITKETKDKVKEGAKAVSDKSSDVKVKTEGIFDDISTFFDTKVETTQDSASDVKKDIVDKIHVEAKVVPEKISDVKIKVGGFFDDVGSTFDKKVETTEDVATAIKTDTDDKVNESAKAITEKSSDVKTKAGKLFDDVGKACDKKVDKTKDVASDITKETKDKVKEGAKAVSEKSSDVKEKIGGFFDYLGSAFDKKFETTEDVTTDIKLDTEDKVKDGAKFVSEKSSDLGANVGGFFDDVGSAFNKEVEKTKYVAIDVKKDTEDNVKGSVKAVSEKSSDIRAQAGGFFDSIGSAFDKKLETTKDVTIDVKKATEDKVKDGATAVSDKGSDVKAKVGGFFDDVSTAFDKNVETTQDIASDIVDKVKVESKVVPDVKTKVGGFFDNVGTTFDKKVETTKDFATGVKKDTDDKVKETAKVITEKSSDVKTSAGVFFDDVGNTFDKKIDTTKDVASDITEETDDKVKEGGKAISEKSSDVKVKVGGLFDDVSTSFDKKVETTQDIASDIKKDIVDKVNVQSKVVPEKINDVKTKVGGFFDSVGSAFDKKVETTKDVATDIKKDTEDKLNETVKPISEKSSDVKTKVGGFFDNIFSNFDKKVETTQDIASDIKKDTDHKVKDSKKTVTEKSDEVKSKIGGFFDDVISVFDENVGTTKDIVLDGKKDTEDVVHRAAKSAEEKSNDLKTSAGGFFDEKVKTTKDIASGIKTDTDDNIKNAAKAVTEKSTDIKTKIGGFLNDVSSDINMKEETTKDDSAMVDVNKSSSIKSKDGEIFEDVGSAFAKNVEIINNVSSGVNKDLTETSHSYLEKIKTIDSDKKNNTIDKVSSDGNMISSFDVHFPSTVQVTDLDVDVQPVEEIHDIVKETFKGRHPESNITQICKSSVLDSDANTDMTSNIRTLSTESASLSNLQLDDNGKAISGSTDEFSTNISERDIDLSTLKTADQYQKDLNSAQPLSFVTDSKKKRLFHIESEEGDFSQNYTVDIDESNIELETPSILEASNDNKTDDDLTKLEEKLSNIDMVLKSMEDDNIRFDNSNIDDTKHTKKLRRIERHFERMASETLEQDKIKATEEKIPTPELERSREIEFQRIVSQLSTEEVSDFQKEYSNIWDDGTFTASEDWESKTPDSTAEVQDLPQGDRWEQSTDSPIEGSSTTKVQPETEEASTTVEGIEQREVPANLHGLSDEMKELLAEMEKQARK